MGVVHGCSHLLHPETTWNNWCIAGFLIEQVVFLDWKEALQNSANSIRKTPKIRFCCDMVSFQEVRFHHIFLN